ncbi:MAG: nuclear transport factor 2 family protein [Saprospiraceae bacterium]|nr:nuclear transport factor 2 family protein [Saprospiraceae bacterium]
MKWIPFVCILLGITACNPKVVDVSEEIQPLIRKNWDQFIEAWESEDASACATFYTDDGINVPPAVKINNGKKDVESFYKFLFDNNISSKYTHTILDMDGDDTQVIEYGKFSVDWMRNDSTEWTYHARTMTHWVNENGTWKIDKFLFNNPPEE